MFTALKVSYHYHILRCHNIFLKLDKFDLKKTLKLNDPVVRNSYKTTLQCSLPTHNYRLYAKLDKIFVVCFTRLRGIQIYIPRIGG